MCIVLEISGKAVGRPGRRVCVPDPREGRVWRSGAVRAARVRGHGNAQVRQPGHPFGQRRRRRQRR